MHIFCSVWLILPNLFYTFGFLVYTIINDYFTSIGILFFNIIYICFSHYFNRFLCWDVCLSDDSQHFNEYFVSFPVTQHVCKTWKLEIRLCRGGARKNSIQVIWRNSTTWLGYLRKIDDGYWISLLKLMNNSWAINKRNQHLISVLKPDENFLQGTLKFSKALELWNQN